PVSMGPDEQVIIRRYRRDDAGPLCDAAVESTAQIFPWMPWCHATYSLDESNAWIDHCDAAWKEGTSTTSPSSTALIACSAGVDSTRSESNTEWPISEIGCARQPRGRGGGRRPSESSRSSPFAKQILPASRSWLRLGTSQVIAWPRRL